MVMKHTLFNDRDQTTSLKLMQHTISGYILALIFQ